MGNKTTLQTNNATITENNTDLATILETINNLPSSSSGTTETWIFTMEDGSTVTKEVVVE